MSKNKNKKAKVEEDNEDYLDDEDSDDNDYDEDDDYDDDEEEDEVLLPKEEESVLNKYSSEIEVNESDPKNRTLKLQQLISHFEFRLLGYMWRGGDEKYVFSGRPLVGDATLQQIMLLLHPFSREIILISDKDDELWQKQLVRTRVDFAATLINAFDVDASNMKNLWRAFTNLMFNIGDIILKSNSKGFMEKVFNLNDNYNDGTKDFFGSKGDGET